MHALGGRPNCPGIDRLSTPSESASISEMFGVHGPFGAARAKAVLIRVMFNSQNTAVQRDAMVLRYVCLPSVAAGYKMLDELVMLCKLA